MTPRFSTDHYILCKNHYLFCAVYSQLRGVPKFNSTGRAAALQTWLTSSRLERLSRFLPWRWVVICMHSFGLWWVGWWRWNARLDAGRDVAEQDWQWQTWLWRTKKCTPTSYLTTRITHPLHVYVDAAYKISGAHSFQRVHIVIAESRMSSRNDCNNGTWCMEKHLRPVYSDTTQLELSCVGGSL